MKYFEVFFGLFSLLMAWEAKGQSPLISRKFEPKALQQDFRILKGVLESHHPSLYTFIEPKDWEEAYRYYEKKLSDTLSEREFLFGAVLPLISKIRCGHTSARYSKKHGSHNRMNTETGFPLQIRCWADSMVVLSTLHRNDSAIPRGTVLRSIDNMSTEELKQAFFECMPSDGYNETHNYYRLSSNFPYFHKNVFGLKNEYTLSIQTHGGKDSQLIIKAYDPGVQSNRSESMGKNIKPISPANRRALQFYIDTLSGSAIMKITTFGKRFGSGSFFRKHFRELKKSGVQDLIIDIRNNGGGYVDNLVKLARYVKKDAFYLADSTVAVKRGFSGYGKYFRNKMDDWFVLRFLTRKDEKGKYHIKYWERKRFRPINGVFFAGRIHILVSGPTFSAASLFAGLMKGQDNVTLLGEETGGGAYFNNGLMMPECTLPNSGIRVRIPLFRIVSGRGEANTGRGVQPDIQVNPTYESIRNGIDLKLDAVRKLILENPLPKKS